MNNHLSTNNVIMIGILIRQQAFDKLGEENRNQLIGYIILLLLMIISKIQILQHFGHKMLNFFLSSPWCGHLLSRCMHRGRSRSIHSVHIHEEIEKNKSLK